MSGEIERYSPEMRGRIAYEHIQRYLFAANFVADKTVLDVACGEGYGSGLLSSRAARVVGLDIDRPAIAAATERYRREGRVEFEVGDCLALPFADGAFDAVVSFETIEHLLDHTRFLAELRRVLRPGGLLIISTPNRATYSSDGRKSNPFHLKELDEGEFRAALGSAFGHVHMFGQRFLLPSLVWPLDEPARRRAKKLALALERTGKLASPASLQLEQPEYLLAVCSDGPIAVDMGPALFLDRDDDLWLEHDRVLRWASGVHDETERLRASLRLTEGQRDALAARPAVDAAALTGAVGTICDIVPLLQMAGALASAVDRLFEDRAAPLAAFGPAVAGQIENAAAAHREAAALRERLDRASGEMQTMQAQIEALRAECESVRSARAGLDAALADVRALLLGRETELGDLEAQLRELRARGLADAEALQRREAELSEAERAAARSQETLTILGGELDAARRLLSAHEATLRERDEDLRRRMQDRDALEAAADGLRSTVAELRQSEDGARSALATLRTEMQAERRASRAIALALEHWSEAARSNEAALAEIKHMARVVGIRRGVTRSLADAGQLVRRRLAASAPGVCVDRAQLRPAPGTTPTRRKLGWSERRRFERAMQFDRDWYLKQNPDVAEKGGDPLAHYLAHGLFEERDPNPAFSAVWYRQRAPEPLGDTPAYLHFLADPARRAWPRHPLFDAEHYVATHRDLGLKPAEAFDHFMTQGARELRNPHLFVNMKHLAAQPGFETSENPLFDYLADPALHDASPHPLFDAAAYLADNPDVADGPTNPLLHYRVAGWREGRAPHPLFAGDWYLAAQRDVLDAGVDPFEHYLRHGAAEGRKPHPLFDADYYLERNPGAGVRRSEALEHYAQFGAARELETTRAIDVATMRAFTPAPEWRRFDPITAFTRFGRDEVDIPPHFVTAGETPQMAWPPTPQPQYWLPQGLRDYIVERHGEPCVSLYVYLMAMVERHGDKPEQFAGSRDLRTLRARMDTLAEAMEGDERDIEVSIVIPVYNNLVYTLTSVISILEQPARRRYEIIIGDDRSADATPTVFGAVAAVVRLLRHEKNLGFLSNCNACAATARGRYVVMLNNDTLVMPGWLDELIDPFECDPAIGLTGSKLLNGDGTLQEAGGIFWRDGSAWNFGRNGDPRRPEFNYLKDVDYISGASIALPRDLWEQLGGFDPAFTPAYCEDSDIAFRIRAVGRRTVYAPHSELIHHEGKSHGRDTASGTKAYQVANNRKLIERWKDTLAAQNFPNGEHVFLARDRSRGTPHVLIVDHYIPQWDRDAGSRTILHFIRMFLANGFRVTFWPENLFEDRVYCQALQKLGVEVIYSAAYVNRFVQFLFDNGRYFDYVLLSRPHIAIGCYSSVRGHSQAKILYYGHDIHHRRMMQEMETKPSDELMREIEATRLEEFRNWALTDVVLYPSEDEREAVLAELPDAAVAAVPMLGYTPAELAAGQRNLQRFEARDVDDLVFVGGSHPPNVDALLWFTRDVFPLVLEGRPTTRLNIVGSSVHNEVRAMASESIIIRGRLSDAELETLYAQAGVAVIPLRFGAGVKGKTVEALFNAIPFVATSVGMQGLRSDEPIGFTADQARDFADAVLRAQSDREEARKRVARGLDFVAERYSIAALARAFAPFVDGLARDPSGAKPAPDEPDRDIAAQEPVAPAIDLATWAREDAAE